VLKDRKGTTFSTEDGINDWVTLVETLLMWVQWLKSDEMPKILVKRSKKKHQFLMYLIKKVKETFMLSPNSDRRMNDYKT
jgi:hypothetical protein